MDPADVAGALPPGGAPGDEPPLAWTAKPAEDVACILGCGAVLHARGVKVARPPCGHLCMCHPCSRRALVTNPYCPVCRMYIAAVDHVRVGVVGGTKLMAAAIAPDAWRPNRCMPRGALYGCRACWKPFRAEDTRLVCAFPGCGTAVHGNAACAGGLAPNAKGTWVCGRHLVGGAVTHAMVLGPEDTLRMRLLNIESELCSTCRKRIEPGRMIQCHECGWRGCKDHMVGTCDCGRLACPVCTDKWKGSSRCVLCFVDEAAAKHKAAEETDVVEEPANDTSSEEEWDADDEDSSDDDDGGGCACAEPNPVDLQLCRVGCDMVCRSCAAQCSTCPKLVCDDHVQARCGYCAAHNLCPACYARDHAKGACTAPKPAAIMCTWDAAHGTATTHCTRGGCKAPICAGCVCRLPAYAGRGWCNHCVLYVDSAGGGTATEDAE